MGYPASSRQGAPLGEGFFPHFVGGIYHPKSLLFSPYPAIPPYVVRTPHPGMTDDHDNGLGWAGLGCNHRRRRESPAIYRTPGN